ncbi:hypothetical protein PIB30_043144 [Stylosanthes scabra]|uniref:Uncharacterized protein n=1 Tax=Stylosanthes scabra TaxID=79078 RepID=A0ABU6YG19_9FABA|nr:hypothetical protein [Stylosanthes scabra]
MTKVFGTRITHHVYLVKVELGFKEAWTWLENVKFQFWPSFNELQQRKVAYATPECSSKASGEDVAKVCAQLAESRILPFAPLHESFASNAFLSLSHAFLNP